MIGINLIRAHCVCRRCHFLGSEPQFVKQFSNDRTRLCRKCRSEQVTAWKDRRYPRRHVESRAARQEKKDAKRAKWKVLAEKFQCDVRKTQNYLGKIKSIYGVSRDEYVRMAEYQGHRCAICGQMPTTGKSFLSLDHCHATGLIRGLLCNHCNTALGFFGDSAERLRKAAAYLTFYAETPSDENRSNPFDTTTQMR